MAERRFGKFTSSPHPLALILVVYSLVLSYFVDHTLVHSDEIGYILNARRLLGGPSSQLTYFPGYSIVLTPVLVFTRDPEFIVRGVQLINALLAGVVAILSWRFVASVRPSMPTSRIFLITLVTSMYPAFRLFSTLALSENLTIPLTLALALAAARLAQTPSRQRMLITCACAGLTVLVHPRLIAAAGATVIVAVYLQWKDRREILAALLATVGGLALAVGLARLILASPTGTFSFAQSQRTTTSGLVTSNLGFRQLAALPFTALGQLFYLSVGTLTLGPLGAIGLWRSIREGKTSSRSTGVLAGWVALNCLATLVVSSMFMNLGTGDKAIYGRYLEAVILPVLLFGAIQLFEPVSALHRRVATLFPGAAAALLIIVRNPDAFGGRRQLINISAIEPLVELTSSIDLPFIATVGVFLTLTLLMVARNKPTVACAGIGVLFAVGGVVAVNRAHDALVNFERYDDFAAVMQDQFSTADMEDIDCVSVDNFANGLNWQQQNLRLQLIDIDLQNWQRDSGASPCSPFVLTSDPALSASIPHARLLAVDPTVAIQLWVVDPAVQRHLEAAGRPGVADPAAILPIDQTLKVEILEVSPTEAPGVFDIRLALTNTADRALVPSGGLPDGFGGYAVGLEWREGVGGSRVSEPRRARLEAILWPGETTEIEIELAAIQYPVGEDPIRLDPGSWLLRAEVVQEGVRWLEDSASDETLVDVAEAVPE